MPLGLYGMLTENYWIAGVAWIAASLGSLTVVFIAGWLSLAWALFHSNVWPLIALMPAAIKLVSHFLFTDNLRASLIKVASSIGFNDIKNAEVKYKREKI